MLSPLVAPFLHLMHGRSTVPRLSAVVAAMLGVHGRVQVHVEGEDVEAEDEGDDPLEDGGDVPVLEAVHNNKGDGQADGDDDEGQLDPEGDGEDAVLGVVDAEALVLGADEDGREQVADDEEAEEDVVQARVAGRVEDAQADEADSADEGPEDGEAREDLFAQRRVGHEAAAVAEPAVREERGVEQHGGEDAARDEERLELAGADVGDVGDHLAVFHGRILFEAGVDDPCCGWCFRVSICFHHHDCLSCWAYWLTIRTVQEQAQ